MEKIHSNGCLGLFIYLFIYLFFFLFFEISVEAFACVLKLY